MESRRYAVAYNLVGFPTSSLRVWVREELGNYVNVVTASVLDCGTQLTLNRSQIEYEWEWEEELPLRHVDGLVALAA
jgi:hypothetical protein